MSLRVLGIETSCDETAAAVVDDTGLVLSDVVHSQVELHRPYGGVVPELASRDHLRKIRPVLQSALEQSGVSLRELDGIAVTSRPGLSGALLVGVQVAQGLAWAADKPLVMVDHLVGHLLAAFLSYPEREQEHPTFPFLAVLASGGHTGIYAVQGPDLSQILELGATRDDAAGEAFDKVAKLLGLGYPGGPIIDKLASEGDPGRVQLSRPMPSRRSLEFSFSGLKTNVARWVERHGRPGNDQRLRDLCAAFQRRVVDTLIDKAIIATTRERLDTIVLCGGVAANRELRATAKQRAAAIGKRVIVPPISACTDNGAMIAYAGSQRLVRGADDRGHIVTSPRTALLRVTKKGPGRRQTNLRPA